MLNGLFLLAFLIFCGGAASAAFLATGKEARQQAAQDTWSVVILRNGVTAESPFHTLSSQMNRPGMVEVFPQSHTPAPTPTLAMSTAPVPTPAQLKPSSTKGRDSENNADDAGKVFTTKERKTYKGYPQGSYSAEVPPPEAIAGLNELIKLGEKRKTVLAWAVFGSSGGKVYATAKPTIEKALKNA